MLRLSLNSRAKATTRKMPGHLVVESADSQTHTPGLTLDSLRRGRSATILALGGDDGVTRRLRELGFLPGVEVEMIGSAPLGDPLAVFVRGSRMALRRRDARRIFVAAAT